MCGIIGYAGHRDACGILLDGLKRLEYRGYDSAGMAVVWDGRLDVRKAVGKLCNLAGELQKQCLSGPLGLAHTRWRSPCSSLPITWLTCSAKTSISRGILPRP